MISKKYEIRKQVLGGDPDLEKSGRILNRVVEWDRDGITIETDQRPVREIMSGLELERSSHSATPCAVERRDESKGENRCGRGQTKRRWDDVNDDDNRDRTRMADDDAIDSQALPSGTLATRRILTSVLRRPRWRQCRAGNAFAGRRIRDGETGSHPEKAEILRDELTQVFWTTELFKWSFHMCLR